jgi:FkbM family methyltransferase
MASVRALLYRMFFVLKKSATEGALHRWPGASRKLEQFQQLVQCFSTKTVQAWVRVQSGLSKGMWIEISIPGEGFLWRGEHEPEVQNAISAVLRPGAVFYDVGAHVGAMALGAANMVGESGRVVAFDPEPENAQRLHHNAARNGFEGRLRVVYAAVWSHSTQNGISFRRGATVRSQGGIEVEGNRPVLASGEIINVPAITLDDFIATGEPPPQLIKIDVEGGEYEVLRGGARLFAPQRPRIIVEVHHRQAADQITAWLREYQYEARWDIPKEDFPRRLFAWPAEQEEKPWRDLSANAD